MMQVKSGEIEKLGLLYERHKKNLFGFFYKMNRSSTVSEDMVQNVFTNILKSKHTFTGEGKFSTWMFHIARNVNFDHYRKNQLLKYQTVDSHEVDIAAEDNVEDLFKKDQDINRLSQAIHQLEPDKKEVLILSRFENLKYKEIGQIIGCSEGAVKMKIRRTLIELKNVYTKLERGSNHAA